MSNSEKPVSFADLQLPASLLSALSDVGYEFPTPIQAATIPPLLEGRDLVGMAQTGTGKTAAFALPILSQVDVKAQHTQALILTPTRELALQVSEAFQTYAHHLKGFHVLPVYGGQDMRLQLRGLKRGAHVVVGTPGRLLDHLQRKSLDLSNIKTMVLDEADEMLRMGFIDDVQTILEKTPPERQVALFSATMPAPIRRVAKTYLKDPKEISIKCATSTNDKTEQFYWIVSGTNKLDALTRMLEVENFDGMIIFVRTKTATAELADKLNARGFAAAALNGDMNQTLRQRTVDQLKRGQLDILIATDVAARGLDVERITHVINYDIPYDAEAYVHRIGRTGRAGRSGKAILFVAPREKRLLQTIEKTTRQSITPIQLPSRSTLLNVRIDNFKKSVAQSLAGDDLAFFEEIVEDICLENQCDARQLAAALAKQLQKDRPLKQGLDEKKDKKEKREKHEHKGETQSRAPKERKQAKKHTDSERAKPSRRSAKFNVDAEPLPDFPDISMRRYRLSVGHDDQISPREIVGSIANEADIDGDYIGKIYVHDSYSTVDLPEGMPKEVFQHLKKIRIGDRSLNIQLAKDAQAKEPSKESSKESSKEYSRESATTKHKSSKKSNDRKPKASAGKRKNDSKRKSDSGLAGRKGPKRKKADHKQAV